MKKFLLLFVLIITTISFTVCNPWREDLKDNYEVVKPESELNTQDWVIIDIND